MPAAKEIKIKNDFKQQENSIDSVSSYNLNLLGGWRHSHSFNWFMYYRTITQMNGKQHAKSGRILCVQSSLSIESNGELFTLCGRIVTPISAFRCTPPPPTTKRVIPLTGTHEQSLAQTRRLPSATSFKPIGRITFLNSYMGVCNRHCSAEFWV